MMGTNNTAAWDAAACFALSVGRLPVARADQNAAYAAVMDPDAFAAFYTRSARSLWAYLARASGDPALADDLTQESFVRFLCAVRPDDGEIASRKYVFGIASNLLRDHWRRPRSVSVDELPEELFSVPDGSSQANAHSMLGKALAGMRPRDQQLLWLAYAEGYSHREIAEITGLGATSIRLLLFRARRLMAIKLGQGDRL